MNKFMKVESLSCFAQLQLGIALQVYMSPQALNQGIKIGLQFFGPYNSEKYLVVVLPRAMQQGYTLSVNPGSQRVSCSQLRGYWLALPDSPILKQLYIARYKVVRLTDQLAQLSTSGLGITGLLGATDEKSKLEDHTAEIVHQYQSVLRCIRCF